MSARVYRLNAKAKTLEEMETPPCFRDERAEKIQQLAISLSYLETEARRAGFDFVAKLIQAACIATKDELNPRSEVQ